MRALILAAGKGTRMHSERAKVLHEVMGRPMLGWVLDVLEQAGIREIAVVAGARAGEVRAFLAQRYPKAATRPQVILQNPQRGTGHAVLVARGFLKSSPEDVLVWPADMPLLRLETVRGFIREHRARKAAASALSSVVELPFGYGRILRSGGRFTGIREELDASEEEKAIREINTGVYLFRTQELLRALAQLRPDNAKQEYYLTDTIAILEREGARVEALPLAEAGEASGINSRLQLAEAMETMNVREIHRHLEQGVTIVKPDQTHIEPGVTIGTDTVIYPWTFIETGVRIGKRCQIGPFTKVRKGTVIGDGSVVGSFVEVNRSKLGKKVLAKHLAYLGDASLGDGTNVGAGTITANYDGKNKHKTLIGKRVMIGSDTVFVAPVTVEDRAKTGAGSVVIAGTRVKKGTTVAGVPARLLRKKKSPQ